MKATDKIFAAILCLHLGVLIFCPGTKSRAAEARVITENGTNILAIGIDARDFTVVRFYLSGTNVLELRQDTLLQKDRPIAKERDAAAQAERDAIIAALKTRTNAMAGDAQVINSNLVRLLLVDDSDERRKRRVPAE